MDFKLHPLNIKFQNLTYRVSKNNGKYVHTIDSPYKLHPCTLRHLIRSAFVDFSMSNFYLNLNFYETWKTKCRRNRCPAAISSSQACDVGCEKRKSEKTEWLILSVLFCLNENINVSCRIIVGTRRFFGSRHSNFDVYSFRWVLNLSIFFKFINTN